MPRMKNWTVIGIEPSEGNRHFVRLIQAESPRRAAEMAAATAPAGGEIVAVAHGTVRTHEPKED